MRQAKQKLHIRLLALLLAVLLLLCVTPAAFADEYSGDCGADLTWSFSDGRLTISGSGNMANYDEWNLPPWYEFREDILWLSLPEGLTSVGNMAFYDCMNLTAVTLPSTVKFVGELAFCQNRNLTVLSLNSGLQSLGRSAFEQCESLLHLRLPDSLTTIGYHAFYSCTGLTYVCVPASVTEMGSGVFAYCESLVQADVYAQLDTLPTWTFYGCDSLSAISLPATVKEVEEYAFSHCESLHVVTYAGTEEEAEEIRSDISEDIPAFGAFGFIDATGTEMEGSSSDAWVEEDGSLVVETTTVTSTDNADISTSVTVVYPSDSPDETTSSAQVNVTLENASGWSEALEKVVKVTEDATLTTQVDVYVKDDTSLESGALDTLAGQNVTVAIHTSSGSDWKVDCSTLGVGTLESNVDFSYERTDAPQETVDELEGAVTYLLRFANSAKINAEVMVKLPRQYATQTAYLYQRIRGDLEFLQAVVIDHNGYAHFYLGSVDSETEYIVGINVPNAEAADVIVPSELHAEYGITENIQPVEYVITGRTSSWGMNISQVTWIMVAVITVCVIGIGVVMFALNKRKLKMGYVPDLDDEE